MHKYGLFVRKLLLSAILLLSFGECQAVPLSEEVDSSYCVVPILGATIGMAKIDYLKTYPIAPHALISTKFGGLWTIRNFNEISTYTPELNLGFLDSSVYSLEQNAVFVFYGSINEAGDPRGEVHKFHGDDYPELVNIDDVRKLGDLRKIQKSQNIKHSHVSALGDGFYGAARNSGLYLVRSSGGSRKVLGNQLVRPLTIELHPMVGRGDVLVNTYNGQFILAENNEANSKYCRQVIPKNNNNFKLTPLLTNVDNDVVWGALKIANNKYLIYMQSDKYWVYDNGVVERIKNISDAMEIVYTKDMKSGVLSERSVTINSQRIFLKDEFYSFFVGDSEDIKFHGDVVSDISQTDSYLLEGWEPGGPHGFAVRGADLDITVLSGSSLSDVATLSVLKSSFRYLFENGFLSITGNNVEIKNFPDFDSWRRGRVAHVHPDINEPQNTIIFEASRGGVYKVIHMESWKDLIHFQYLILEE